MRQIQWLLCAVPARYQLRGLDGVCGIAVCEGVECGILLCAYCESSCLCAWYYQFISQAKVPTLILSQAHISSTPT
jgi:hypothetical protein